MDAPSALPTGGLWHGSNIRANRHHWTATEDNHRPGSRRTYKSDIKQQLAMKLFPDAHHAHDLLAAGDVVSHCSTDGSPAVHGYCLESLIRKGPRSTVWKASKVADGSPVVVKVLQASTPGQLAAALQELQITQQVTAILHKKQHKFHEVQSQEQSSTTAAAAVSTAGTKIAAASSQRLPARQAASQQERLTSATHAAEPWTAGKSTAAAAAALAGPQSDLQQGSSSGLQDAQQGTRAQHLVNLVDSITMRHDHLLTLRQQRATAEAGGVAGGGKEQDSRAARFCQQARKNDSTGGSSARNNGHSSSTDCAAIALVLEPLHQSLSWVLHFVRERQGRMGLPVPAVRSIAHQLLTGLADLHDERTIVHRDIKPSNILLQQPFVVRKGRHKMRNMTLQELSSAQWSIIDLGSAAHLLPLPTEPPAAAAAGPGSSSACPEGSSSSSTWSLVASISNALQQLTGVPFLDGTAAATGAAAAASPSQLQWRVAEGGIAPYETPAYTPPEALLHLPATAAYDVWSAACCIYEAATGRLLFPVEAAAAARGPRLPKQLPTPAAAAGVQSGIEESDDEGFNQDQVHLQMMKHTCGGPPRELLQRSLYASDLFADVDRGRLWMEEEEEGSRALGQQHPVIKNALGFWGIGGKQEQPCRPVLHQLMATRSMPLHEAVALADFLQPMLAWDPERRPTAAQLLQHSYFKPLHLEEQQQQQQKQQ